MLNKTLATVIALSAILAVSSCTEKEPAQTASGKKAGVSLTLKKEIKGFSVPEGFAIDPASGYVYLSNIVTEDEGYWVDDNAGFISKLDGDGNIIELKWLDSAQAQPVHSPKGMTVLDGYLYFTDNAQLKRVPLAGEKKVEIIPLPETKHLNDLTNDGKSVWVSEMDLDKIYKVHPDGTYKEIPSPENVNGIGIYKDKAFAVSWDLHEVYEIDPNGEKAPVPFGLSEHFTNLDGIEILEDGTFIVTDFKGNKVSSISADRKTVTTLAEVESAADFAIDREKKLLYVPVFMRDAARIYEMDY
jgi:DNA-binding beta-propeller fold protein YncE